jgi:hypothetical protein
MTDWSLKNFLKKVQGKGFEHQFTGMTMIDSCYKLIED